MKRIGMIVGGTLLAAGLATAQQRRDPLVYTVRIPIPSTKTFDVEVVVPTERRDSVVLIMPIWSPGMYVLQSYGDRVTAFTAVSADGATLEVTRPIGSSRWIIRTGGASTVRVRYTLTAGRGSNLSNGVSDTSLVIIGPATFATLAGQTEQTTRPAEVRLELPPTWKPAVTSLDAAPDGQPNHFVAPSYDVLADSPILAGAHMSSADVTVGGARHTWAYLGDAEWSAASAAEWVKPLLEEHNHFWGALFPFKKYVFLNIVGGGPGSGVEHLNSVAINTSAKAPLTPEARFRQASFISHEYFHAMNVKRLRPVELGPFDYEHTPVTTGLWVGEGLTSYFGDLLAARAGLGTTQDYLALTSRHITSVQNSPGRLVQTLEQASAQMFERLPASQRIDYYEKGPVVGLVLDAHIRKHTDGKKSMDDVIRLEYKRWSGARGYTGAEFNKTVSDAAGFDVGPLLHKLIATTDEIDYAEMLDWFGLRFAPSVDAAKPSWNLEVRADASARQQAHVAALLARSKAS
jgi:predicted metalloprotease with PDZ domain